MKTNPKIWQIATTCMSVIWWGLTNPWTVLMGWPMRLLSHRTGNRECQEWLRQITDSWETDFFDDLEMGTGDLPEDIMTFNIQVGNTAVEGLYSHLDGDILVLALNGNTLREPLTEAELMEAVIILSERGHLPATSFLVGLKSKSLPNRLK